MGCSTALTEIHKASFAMVHLNMHGMYLVQDSFKLFVMASLYEIARISYFGSDQSFYNLYHLFVSESFICLYLYSPR